MPMFRKKPVVIEAVQFVQPTPLEAWPEGWPLPEIQSPSATSPLRLVAGEVFVETLEGRMHISPGDWIIRGVQGEFYPCKPDIFEQTYEPADTTEEQK